MISQIFTISFIVWAIYITMQEGMIFEKIGVWLEDRIDSEYWSKPVHSCVVCMTPYYGSVAYWIVYCNSVFDWIVTIIAAMGLNVVFIKLIPDDD